MRCDTNNKPKAIAGDKNRAQWETWYRPKKC